MNSSSTHIVIINHIIYEETIRVYTLELCQGCLLLSTSLVNQGLHVQFSFFEYCRFLEEHNNSQMTPVVCLACLECVVAHRKSGDVGVFFGWFQGGGSINTEVCEHRDKQQIGVNKTPAESEVTTPTSN